MNDRPLSAASDDDLVAQSRGGSEAAMVELYRRHRPRVVGYVLRMAGDLHVAEEVLSATFVRFFENLERYRPQGQLAAYLLRIAHSCLVREQVARQRLRPFPPPSPNGTVHTEPAAGTPGPDRLAADRELHERVEQALAALPGHLREVVVLHLYEGLDYAAVGDIVGIGAATARSRMRYALQALRRALLPAEKSGPPNG
jgi:RNA polymerase sigma-70 factor (ECF subfamily)